MSTKREANETRKVNRADQPQRSNRSILWLIVLSGMLLAAAVGYFGYDAQFMTGQLGAFALAGGIATFVVVQLIRSRGRVSLRTLLIVVAVVSAALALLGPGIYDARRESNAVHTLVARGASASYNIGPSNNYYDTPSGWRIPGWIIDILGESYFAELNALSFGHSDVTDADLVAFANIRELRTISLTNEFISADGIASMPLVNGVEEVHLYWSQLSAESAARLAQLPNLERVRITAKPLAVGATPTVDTTKHLVHLGQLRQVRDLEIYTGEYDSDSMAAIASLPQLERLYLGRGNTPPAIDASGIAALGDSQSITDLTVAITSLGDRELSALSRIPSLKILVLNRTSITRQGVRDFQQSRPDVNLIPPEFPEANTQ